MRTATLLSILYAIGLTLGMVGLALLPVAHSHFPELAFVSIVVVSTFLFGATGIVTVSRAEYPMGLMLRGSVARVFGLFNIAIWLFVVVASTIRFFRP